VGAKSGYRCIIAHVLGDMTIGMAGVVIPAIMGPVGIVIGDY